MPSTLFAAARNPFADSANKLSMPWLALCAFCAVVPITGIADCSVNNVNCQFVLQQKYSPNMVQKYVISLNHTEYFSSYNSHINNSRSYFTRGVCNYKCCGVQILLVEKHAALKAYQKSDQLPKLMSIIMFTCSLAPRVPTLPLGRCRGQYGSSPLTGTALRPP